MSEHAWDQLHSAPKVDYDHNIHALYTFTAGGVSKFGFDDLAGFEFDDQSAESAIHTGKEGWYGW